MHLVLISKGVWPVYAPCDKFGKSFVEDCDEDVQDKLISLCDKVAEHGPTSIPVERNHQVDKDENVREFWVGLYFRVFYFAGQRRVIVCTNIYRKKGQKVNKSELAIAVKLKKQYEQAVGLNQVIIVLPTGGTE